MLLGHLLKPLEPFDHKGVIYMPSKLRHTMGSSALSSLVGSPSLPVHSALMAMVPWQLTLCASWPIAFHCWQCCFIASSCVFLQDKSSY